MSRAMDSLCNHCLCEMGKEKGYVHKRCYLSLFRSFVRMASQVKKGDKS